MTARPRRIDAASWPAAAEAGTLLSMLGFDVTIAGDQPEPLVSAGVSVSGSMASVSADWSRSGAMALTGSPGSPYGWAVGRPATVARAAAFALELITGAAVEGAALLGERAATMKLSRQGSTSCGGGTRLMRCTDGWWALNLARDADLVPALVETEVPEPWQAVADWSAHRSASQAVERATLLGLAAGALGETTAVDTPWHVHAVPSTGWAAPSRPLVVNLGALWAGPLAAHLLGLAGARVVHVESASRSDPTRSSAPSFHALLHDGTSTEVVDFTDERRLRTLLDAADVVIEASRPRALAALSLAATDILADGRPRIWLRISGHRNPDRIAFGDDAAVAGGLVAYENGSPVFAGDAVADPLTGLLAALACAALLKRRTPAVVDLHLAEVAAYCARPAGHGAVSGAFTGSVHDAASPHVASPHVASRRPSRL